MNRGEFLLAIFQKCSGYVRAVCVNAHCWTGRPGLARPELQHSFEVLVSELTGPELPLWFCGPCDPPGIPNVSAILFLYSHLRSTNEVIVTLRRFL